MLLENLFLDNMLSWSQIKILIVQEKIHQQLKMHLFLILKNTPSVVVVAHGTFKTQEGVFQREKHTFPSILNEVSVMQARSALSSAIKSWMRWALLQVGLALKSNS